MKAITHSTSFAMLTALAMLTLLALPFTSFAATDWEAAAPTALNFTCLGGQPFPHTIDTITQDVGGNIVGTGHYNDDPSVTWDLEGTIVDSLLTMKITYNSTYFGSIYNLSGSIAANGSASGSVDSNCESFTMPAGSFVVDTPEEPTNPTTKEECKKGGWEDFGFKNQGQCVRFVETGKDSR